MSDRVPGRAVNVGEPVTIPRLVIELDETARHAMDRLLLTDGPNKTTAAHRALQVLDLIRRVEGSGGSVVLVGADGRPERLVIL